MAPQILYLHKPDRAIPFAETFEAMDRLHKAGKFLTLGLSNFAAYELAEVVMLCKYNNWVRPTLFQAMYKRWKEKGGIWTAASERVSTSVVIMLTTLTNGYLGRHITNS